MKSAPRLLSILSFTATALAAGVAAAVPCPNVMFVIDRSGSMTENPNGGSQPPTKWTLTQQAVKTILTKYGDQLPFGLQTYTNTGFGGNSCYTDTKIEVEPAHDTAAKINMLMTSLKPSGGTNTGEAIRRAYESPTMKDPSRGQFLILITDGDPNCNSGDYPNGTYTTGEIMKAAAMNPPIKTFVVGFDGTNGINPDNLNRFAMAGGVPIMGCGGTQQSPCYYSASSAQKLNDALDKIVNFVIGGEFGTTMCDDSCYSTGCPQGQVCLTTEIDPKPHCAPDPCAGVVNCPQGDYCRMGQCVHACLVQCKSNQRCVDGNCVANPCASVQCAGDQVCDPASGVCVTNLCQLKGTQCTGINVCDPLTGNCTFDQCRLIVCPAGTKCVSPHGYCEVGSGGGTDGGTNNQSGRGTVGCAITQKHDQGGVLLAFLALSLVLALVTRRRR